jgi:hypothetical protein
MQYLYQKDKLAVPRNLQNREYSFLPLSHCHPSSFSLSGKPNTYFFQNKATAEIGAKVRILVFKYRNTG